ncbi:MAG: Nramp family divalent metal transporter [Acholeplasmataceae bacterium]
MHKSLSEIHNTVPINQDKNWVKRLFAFVGPAYLVSIGYMDPGNWATDIAGGSEFGYKLIWVLLMSNMMAILLQSLSARLGIASGMDLAQACASHYKKFINYTLWILTELAIIATDLAEVLGSAIGLMLLFHIPIEYGVIITALDTFIVLLVQKFGVRKLEAITIGLISIIGLSFLVEILISQPDYGEMVLGFIPSLENRDALFIAIGILGATVMPHNLYLHSSLVQSRKIEKTELGMAQAIKFNTIDSVVALNLAFFVNAAILVMAAAVFHQSGNLEVDEIQQAYQLLYPILGTTIAPILFGVALIASGQASTITGTLTGQIIMEGFINLRISPWLRRLITRLLAIIPALFVILVFGSNATGALLVLSQVILSLQLSFAVIPLIHFVSEKKLMGKFAIKTFTKIIAWFVALVIMGLNFWLVYDTMIDLVRDSSMLFIFKALILIGILALVVLLIYIIFEPIFEKIQVQRKYIHKLFDIDDIKEVKPFNKIAAAFDFTKSDLKIMSHILRIANKNATLVLMHINESAGANVFGHEINDRETMLDKEQLDKYKDKLQSYGYMHIECYIGYGHPVQGLSQLINQTQSEIAIFGSHGHKGLKDLLFGITSTRVKDKVHVPILIVK